GSLPSAIVGSPTRLLIISALAAQLTLSRTKVQYPPAGLKQARARSRKGVAAAQCVLWANRFDCAIRSTAGSCSGSPALCAAASHPIRITSRLPSRVGLDTELATSSPSRFVGSTTASFIATVTRPRGGASSPLILSRSRSSYGGTRG